MDPLKLKEPKNVTASYDKEADVPLHLPREANAVPNYGLEGGILVRYIVNTREITGFPLMGISEVTNPKRLMK